MGLTVDVPRESPDLGIEGFEQASLAHLFLKEGAEDGGESCDGDKEVGSGGQPGCVVLGEATARDDGVDMGAILQLSAPGV